MRSVVVLAEETDVGVKRSVEGCSNGELCLTIPDRAQEPTRRCSSSRFLYLPILLVGHLHTLPACPVPPVYCYQGSLVSFPLFGPLSAHARYISHMLCRVERARETFGLVPSSIEG